MLQVQFQRAPGSDALAGPQKIIAEGARASRQFGIVLHVKAAFRVQMIVEPGRIERRHAGGRLTHKDNRLRVFVHQFPVGQREH